MGVYTDPTTGEHVGEYEYRDADDPAEVRRDTEWFATAQAARRFTDTGHTKNCTWCGQAKDPEPDSGDFITCPNARDTCVDCCPCCEGVEAKCQECGQRIPGTPSGPDALEARCAAHKNPENGERDE